MSTLLCIGGLEGEGVVGVVAGGVQSYDWALGPLKSST